MSEFIAAMFLVIGTAIVICVVAAFIVCQGE